MLSDYSKFEIRPSLSPKGPKGREALSSFHAHWLERPTYLESFQPRCSLGQPLQHPPPPSVLCFTSSRGQKQPRKALLVLLLVASTDSQRLSNSMTHGLKAFPSCLIDNNALARTFLPGRPGTPWSRRLTRFFVCLPALTISVWEFAGSDVNVKMDGLSRLELPLDNTKRRHFFGWLGRARLDGW